MPFGINLSELLRAGTDSGLGFIAGREARRQREVEQAEKARQQSLADELLRAQIGATEALEAERRRPPTPRAPTNAEIEGSVLEAMEGGGATADILARLGPGGGPAHRAALERIQNQRAAAGRSEASGERATTSAATRTLQQQLNAFALEDRQRNSNANYDSTKASLRSQFPDAPEYMVILASIAAHSDEPDLQSLLIRSLIDAGVLGGPGGS